MSNVINVLGLINDKNDPSSRARILQYLPALEKEKIRVTPRVFIPNNNTDPAPWMFKTGKVTGINPWRFLWLYKSISRLPLLYQQYNYTLIWQNRMIITHQSWYEKKIHIPRVFDFDDAIWLHDGEKNVQEAITSAVQVFAGNEYLAEYASRYSRNVRIIPSVIDTSALIPLEKKDKPFTIGWVGSASNIPYLELVKPAILQFLRLNPDARFMIVSSAPGDLFRFDDRRILFRKWSGEKENELINSFSAGLMPLPDNPYTRGKCSYKMLQYMACGVPVLVSPVGTNKKILNESGAGLAATDTFSWLSGLQELKNNISLYNTCALKGPIHIDQHYSLKLYSALIAEMFRKIAGT